MTITGKGKFHKLTTRDVEIIQMLNGKYGEKAYKKLGVSDSGFDLLKLRVVGSNITHKTAALLETAAAKWLQDIKLDNRKIKPKGWLLQKIMEQQRKDATSIDVSQDVTNALVRIEAKINTLLESQEKILNQQATMLAFQAEFNTAWMA